MSHESHPPRTAARPPWGWALLLAGGLTSVLPAAAAELPPAAMQAVDYARDVAPILASHCLDCHGPETQESQFRLDSRRQLLKGGDSGEPAILPGKSAESHLIRLVAGLEKGHRMPPEGDPLSPEQIGVLRAWIDQGAKGVTGGDEADETITHWSLQPLSKAAPPTVDHLIANGTDRPVANGIDAFIIKALAEKGLTPNPAADRVTLIRRLYLDVLGVPPTPEQIATFAADDRPDAWERLVDDALASPHYGERWARHWLDVVRFAETDGFEMNQERPNAWRYRDYVIAALNDDTPYSRFVYEQIAGDIDAPTAATGFLVGGAYDKVKSPDINLTLMQRQDELADMINTTGTTFLGMTIGCARCHNHKFDPIPQKDFYAFQAVFAGVQHADRQIPRPASPEKLAARAAVQDEMNAVRRQLEGVNARPPVNSRLNEEVFAPVEARFVRFRIDATNDGSEPCLDELEIYTAGTPEPVNVGLASGGATFAVSGTFPNAAIHQAEHINDGRHGNARSWISNQRGQGWVQIELAEPTRINRIVWGRDRTGGFTDRLAVRYVIEAAREPGRWEVVASSALRLPFGSNPAAPPAGPFALSPDEVRRATELSQRLDQLNAQYADLSSDGFPAYAGTFNLPGPTHRLYRGDPLAPREPVEPGGLSALGAPVLPMDAPEHERRAKLGEWMTGADNPLTPRVIVNRLWHYHFGTGIVDTPSDLGRNGGVPTHPELLDWLAGELIRGDWSLKRAHRLILTSNTYRQSAAARPDAMRVDAGTRYLWRFPPRRLEAEVIRDGMLAAAGVIDWGMEGAGFSPFEPNNNYVRVYQPKQSFGPAEWRRMVYMTKVRMENDATFGAFDCPDAGQVAPKRARSTTSIQALNLFNSGFTLQQAGLLAERLEREAGGDRTAQIDRAFALVLGRPPEPAEREGAATLVKEHGLPALCRTLFNANEFLFIP